MTDKRRRLGPSARGFGTWTTFVGLVLQLIGLSWDGVLHTLDPGLAVHEGVFSVGNPSHLLFLLGLGLAVGGVCACMWISWTRGAGSGPRRLAPFTGAVALLGLVATTGGIALATGAGLLGSAHHDGLAPSDHVHAQTVVPDSLGPTLASLLQEMHTAGTELAFAKLAELANGDAAVEAQTHSLAHALGRSSFGFYGSAPAALQHCTPAFESGCYHGVLEAYFEDGHQVQPSEMGSLCDSWRGANVTTFLTFQCLHGLGHGIMANFGDDLPKALTYCDYLGTDWDRNSCYGGVFMENLMVEFDRRYTASETQVPAAGPVVKIVRQDDPLYPCDSVEEKYLQGCYGLQSSIILMLNNYDFGLAASTCETAPTGWIDTCFRGIGRDAAGYARLEPQRAADLCMLGGPEHRPGCFAGVAQTLANASAGIDGALAFCQLAPAESKPACNAAAGEIAATLFSDDGAAAAACGAAENGYGEICRAAASRRR